MTTLQAKVSRSFSTFSSVLYFPVFVIVSGKKTVIHTLGSYSHYQEAHMYIVHKYDLKFPFLLVHECITWEHAPEFTDV